MKCRHRKSKRNRARRRSAANRDSSSATDDACVPHRMSASRAHKLGDNLADQCPAGLSSKGRSPHCFSTKISSGRQRSHLAVGRSGWSPVQYVFSISSRPGRLLVARLAGCVRGSRGEHCRHDHAQEESSQGHGAQSTHDRRTPASIAGVGLVEPDPCRT